MVTALAGNKADLLDARTVTAEASILSALWLRILIGMANFYLCNETIGFWKFKRFVNAEFEKWQEELFFMNPDLKSNASRSGVSPDFNISRLLLLCQKMLMELIFSLPMSDERGKVG